ncbi:MAG TPA: hypothetical protein VEP90_06415 [Methylomirabilota bacterium]|nr:hypothetical protein [Methylomirabilota bacterium]
MADLGEPLRRITVIPKEHPVPGIEDPNPIHAPIQEPTEPVPAETTPSREPAKPELVPAE